MSDVIRLEETREILVLWPTTSHEACSALPAQKDPKGWLNIERVEKVEKGRI